MPLTPEEQEEKELLQQLLVKRGARQGTVLDKIPIYKDPYSAATGGPATTLGDLVRSTPDILQSIAAAGGTIGGGAIGNVPGALAGGALGSAAGTAGRDYLTETFPSVFGEKRKPIIEFTGNNIADEAIFDTLLNTVTAGMGKLGGVKGAIGRSLGTVVPDLPADVISDVRSVRAAGLETPNFTVGATQPIAKVAQQIGSPVQTERIRRENLGLMERTIEKLVGKPGEDIGEISQSTARRFNELPVRVQKRVGQAPGLTTPIERPLALSAGTASAEQIRGANLAIKANRQFEALELGIKDLDDAIEQEKKNIVNSIAKNLPKANSKFAQRATIKVPEVDPESLKSFKLTNLETQRNSLTNQLNTRYPEELRKVLRKQSSEIMDAAFKNPDTARQLIEVSGKQEIREQAISQFWKKAVDSEGNFDPKIALQYWRDNKGLNSQIFQGRQKALIDQYLNVAQHAPRKAGELGLISLWWRGQNAMINLGRGALMGFAPTSGLVTGGLILSGEAFTRKVLLNPQIADIALGLAKAKPGSKESLDYIKRMLPVLQGSKAALFRRNPDGSTEITDPNFIIPSTKRGER